MNLQDVLNQHADALETPDPAQHSVHLEAFRATGTQALDAARSVDEVETVFSAIASAAARVTSNSYRPTIARWTERRADAIARILEGEPLPILKLQDVLNRHADVLNTSDLRLYSVHLEAFREIGFQALDAARSVDEVDAIFAAITSAAARVTSEANRPNIARWTERRADAIARILP